MRNNMRGWLSYAYVRNVAGALLLVGSLPLGTGMAQAGFDGDGNVDAVFANKGEPNRVCLGDGTGGFTCSDITGSGQNSTDVALGFVDGDATLDAVFARNGTRRNKVCLGDGVGGFTCSNVSDDRFFTLGVALTPSAGINKHITGGPDEDGDGSIDLVVEIGQMQTTEYEFDITYSNSGGPPVVIVDTVPAEWVLTEIAATAVDVDACGEADTVSDGFGSVDVFKGGKPGKKCRSATHIKWTPPADGGLITVAATTRQSPGKQNVIFAPTSCGALYLNDGAQVFALVDGEPPPPLFTSKPLILAAVEDVNGDGQIARNGSGDEDGDGLRDLQEVSGDVVTDPCNPDTDGDSVNDQLDQCPLQGWEVKGSVDAVGCPITG